MNRLFDQTKKAANKARQASIQNLSAASTALSNASGTNIKLTTAKTDEELKRLFLNAPVLFSGLAWKRRGGLGKLASYSSAWEPRFLQLRGTVLLYFDSDPSKALSSLNDPQELLRGYIDFEEEKVTLQASYGHSGAPSPFCLSIKVTNGMTQETKWKLCFDHHQTQMEWLSTLSDLLIQHSVDNYNQELLKAANPSQHGTNESSKKFLRRPPVYEPGSKDLNASVSTSKAPRSNSFQLVDCPHQLWMMEDYHIDRKSMLSEEQKARHRTSVDTALQVMERLLSDERNQRAVAAKRVIELEEILMEETRAKEEYSRHLAEMTREKKILDEELSIRVSTHNLDGHSTEHDDEKTKLNQMIESLKQELESTNTLKQEEKGENDIVMRDMKHQIAGLRDRLRLVQEEHHRAMQTANEQISQRETMNESMQQRIDELERELESNKKDYQESIQALAMNFQESVGIAKKKEQLKDASAE